MELEIADIQFEMNNIHNGYFGSILEMPERNFNNWFSAFKSMLNDLLNDLTLFSLQPIISTKKVLKLLENQQHSFRKDYPTLFSPLGSLGRKHFRRSNQR